MSKRKLNSELEQSSNKIAKPSYNFWQNALLQTIKNKQAVIFEDDQVAVIKDGYPKARCHFLVVSKREIDSINECTINDLQLLKRMERVGHTISKEYGSDDQNFRYGFHARPSLSRLHLHVISQDFDSPCLKNKKHWNSFNTDFFRDSSDVIEEIEKMGEAKKFNENEIERLLKSDLNIMSWLADIAGKAEGLLNQLDQTAAIALQKSSRPSSVQSFGMATVISSDVVSPSTSDFRTGTSVQKDQRPSYSSSLSSFPSKLSAAIPSREDIENERLIDYLNDNDSHSSFNKFSRKSSSSSLRSLPIVVQQSTSVQSSRAEATPTKEVEIQKSSLVEKNLTDCKVREQDYQKALQAKDGQLAVLRVRLQDVEQQLHLKNERLKKMERDQEKLANYKSESSVLGTVENLEKRMKDAEVEFEREKTAYKKMENEFLARIQRLELEQSGTLQQLTSVQKDLTGEKIRCNEFTEQLKLAKYNLESNKLEFDEYKQKATKILQSKEKLIATLKNEDGASATSSENTNLLIQLEELKTERDLLKEDLQQAHLQLYNLRNEAQELESQLAQEQRATLEQQRSLQDQCQTYQQASAQYREQYEQLKQDYQCVQDELRRQHLVLQNILREKDTEITRLINQVAQRTPKSANENEKDLRIKQLTENLIQKQTMIEALQTDKQSLSLQLERLEKLYREAESAAIRASSSSVIEMGANEEGLHSRIPNFLREAPFDTSVARSVKKAYSTVEKFNVRFGVFLRRYPLARLSLFFYAMLLHFWVMLVLFTYTPEMHSPDYKSDH